MSDFVEPYKPWEFEAAYRRELMRRLDWEGGWDAQPAEVKRLYTTARLLPKRVKMERVSMSDLRGALVKRPLALAGFAFETAKEQAEREALELTNRCELDLEVHFANETSEMLCLGFDEIAALKAKTIERDVCWFNAILRSMQGSGMRPHLNGYGPTTSKLRVRGAPFDILFATSRWKQYACAE